MNDEERRYAAFSAVEEARKAEDKKALGWALIRLSQLIHQIGAGDAGNAFVSSAGAGAEAVAIFRELDDPRGLAIALRVGAVSFVGVDVNEMVDESIQIANRIGDVEQEAWGRLQRGRTQHNVEEVVAARGLFTTLGNRVGEGFALQSYAIQAPIPRVEKAALLEKAAELLREGGEGKHAHRALIMAETFGSPDIGIDEQIRLLERAVEFATQASERALALRCLTRIAEEAGKLPEANRYRSQEDALDIEIYGSRGKRLERDIEMYTDVLEVSTRKEKKALKVKLSTLRNELNTLLEG